MGATKNNYIKTEQDKQWHYNNCTIETETEILEGITTAWCIEHLVDITDCLPEPIEPDAYTNSEENLNATIN